MNRDKADDNTRPFQALTLFRGLYKRIATKLDVDPSYVSRVARGERQSEVIEAALRKEMQKILGDGHGDGHRLDGHGSKAHRDGQGAKGQRVEGAGRHAALSEATVNNNRSHTVISHGRPKAKHGSTPVRKT